MKKIEITENGRLLAGVLFANAALYILLGWAWLGAILITLSSMAALAILSILTTPRSLDGFSLTEEEVQVGDEVFLKLRVNNTFRLHLLAAKYEVEVRRITNRGKVQLPPLSGAVSRTKRVNQIQLDTRRRSHLQFGPLKVYHQDMFGLLRRVSASPGVSDLWVFPQIERLNFRKVGEIKDLSFSTSNRTTQEDLDIHGLRNYAFGDQLRNISWKLSAKFGELKVKEFDESFRSKVVFLATENSSEYGETAGDGDPNAASTEFELLVSSLLSLEECAKIGSRAARQLNTTTRRDYSELALSTKAPSFRKAVHQIVAKSPEVTMLIAAAGQQLLLRDILTALEAELPPLAKAVVLQSIAAKPEGAASHGRFAIINIHRASALNSTRSRSLFGG